MKEQEISKKPQNNPIINEIIGVRRKAEDKLSLEKKNKEQATPFYNFLNSYIDSNFDNALENKKPDRYRKMYLGYFYPYKHLEISTNFEENENIRLNLTKFDNFIVINFEALDYTIEVNNQEIKKTSKEIKKVEFNEFTKIGGPPMPPMPPIWTDLAKLEEIQGYIDIFKTLEEKDDIVCESSWQMSLSE